ncbi:LysR family transcriptional regulator [Bacillus sp. BRMEA1]|uniref:LysR family transcriptional regulator n=1 Tax=Neobacillus endophyticus TaxID=2738405 RepID=UPI00156438ED|nr:LysR family transcriptional regulator [Neobacillus endophyticus]NRD77124.1 LysR family transcriptional regulator [Neobacillus endophyticus]
MEIKWMKTFVVTAKYENFRKTSEELFLTQPAVTKHIKRLEETLNIHLFERNGNKVALTPAGHRFYTYAKELVEKYERGMEEFEAWKQGYSRKLVIAAAPQIASSFLPAMLRTFMDENPDIEVVINVLKSYDIGEEISSGRADLGLSRILPIQANIKSIVVHQESVILVGPYKGKVKEELSEQLIFNQYRLITHNHPDYWDLLLKDVKRHYPTVQTMAVNQVEVTKRFIEEGLGASYLPLTVVKDEIGRNKMEAIQPDKIIPPKSATYLLTKVVTDEVRLFTDFLQESTLIW